MESPTDLAKLRARHTNAHTEGVLLLFLGGTVILYLAPQSYRTSPVVQGAIIVPYNWQGGLLTVGQPPTERDRQRHARQQIAVARSRLVIGSALRDPKVNNLACLKDHLEPIEWVEARLKIDYSADSEILYV